MGKPWGVCMPVVVGGRSWVCELDQEGVGEQGRWDRIMCSLHGWRSAFRADGMRECLRRVELCGGLYLAMVVLGFWCRFREDENAYRPVHRGMSIQTCPDRARQCTSSFLQHATQNHFLTPSLPHLPGRSLLHLHDQPNHVLACIQPNDRVGSSLGLYQSSL